MHHLTLFFKLTTDRIAADVQHASRVAYSRSVEGHLEKLGLHGRITGLVSLVSHKCALTISTPISLSSTACFTETLLLLSAPAMLTNNCF